MEQHSLGVAYSYFFMSNPHPSCVAPGPAGTQNHPQARSIDAFQVLGLWNCLDKPWFSSIYLLYGAQLHGC